MESGSGEEPLIDQSQDNYPPPRKYSSSTLHFKHLCLIGDESRKASVFSACIQRWWHSVLLLRTDVRKPSHVKIRILKMLPHSRQTSPSANQELIRSLCRESD